MVTLDVPTTEEEVYESRKRIKLTHSTDASAGVASTSISTHLTVGLNQDFIAFDYEETVVAHGNTEGSSAGGKGKGKGGEDGSFAGSGGNGQSRGTKRTLLEMMDSSRPLSSAEEQLSPWLSKVNLERCRDVTEMLQDEVLAFVDWMAPTSVEHATREMVVEHIRRQVVGLYNGATVHAFGSFATGLYLPGGDIDLVILIKTDVEVLRVLRSLAKRLQKCGIARNIQVISGAKVPIIKFNSTVGDFHIDISINQDNGIRAGALVNRLTAQYPALRALVVVVKAFLVQRSLNEVYMGGLGSYSVVLMAVSFLQMHPKFRNGEIDPLDNIGVLVVEFFEFYGLLFNYELAGISIVDGGSYFNKVDRGWLLPKQTYLLSVEDPLDPRNDVSKSSYGMQRVKHAFAGAYHALSQALVQRAAQLNDKHSGWRSVDQSDHYDDLYKSILVAIINVPNEAVEKRRKITDLYDSKVLHQSLDIQYIRHPESPPYLTSLKHILRNRKSSDRRHRSRSRSRSPSRRRRRRSKSPKDRSRKHKDSSRRTHREEKRSKEDEIINEDGSIVTNAPSSKTPTTSTSQKKNPSSSAPHSKGGSSDEDTRYGALESKKKKTRRGMERTGSRAEKQKDKFADLEFVTDDDASDGVKMVVKGGPELGSNSEVDGGNDTVVSSTSQSKEDVSSDSKLQGMSNDDERSKGEEKTVAMVAQLEDGEIQDGNTSAKDNPSSRPSVSRGSSVARREYWSAKSGVQ
ncbi:hypothetical protein FRC03_011941 [Tulasnella sp. 419]|nr:hypothetical protein FRC03_011941 [Tulasnella sp. 419]